MSLRARLGAALSALTLTLLVLVARPALAWVDVNVEGDDVRLSIDRSGEARVEHRITLKIAGGPLRHFDIKGVDRDAVPELEGYVVSQREAARSSLASAVPVVAERMPPETRPRADGSPAPTVLRVRFDNDRGLGRGVYVLLVRYTTRLGGRITPAGALARVTWRGPVWDDGFDSARVTFDLPAAPTEPRADDAELRDAEGAPAGRAPVVLSTVRRGTARDQIELLRPYAPKTEAITWAIRVDARALQASAPLPAGPKGVRAALESALREPGYRSLLAVGAVGILALYGLLVALKSLEVARHASAAGVPPRPLVPLPIAARAVLAGAALAAGIFVQMVLERGTPGALLVLAAVLLAAHRTPLYRLAGRLRGPGRWLSVSEEEAFRDAPRPTGAYLDVSTRAGKALLVLLLGAVFGLAWVIADDSPFRAHLVALDATALLAIFCTGRIAELPPDPATAPARFLRGVARRIRKSLPEVRLVGRIRVPDGGSRADELRLAVAPRTAPAGFVAIEVGVVYVRGAGGAIGLPEVLLRVAAGSACAEAAARIARQGRPARGRKKGERVVALTPRLPTARMTAAVAIGLVRALEAAHAARDEGARPARRAA
jgi:hypothetical protein